MEKIKEKYEEFRRALEKIIREAVDMKDFFRKVKKIERLKREFRKELQLLVNQWAREDGHTHPPVYISYKPKISIRGLYFPKGWTGGIVIFVIDACDYPCDPEDLEIVDLDDILDTLKHEYIHHLLRNIGCGTKGKIHTPLFYDTYKKRFK
ncbi:MAG: hypothetical protein ABIM98_08895 [candidate division WOR-3 bacterium]